MREGGELPSGATQSDGPHLGGIELNSSVGGAQRGTIGIKGIQSMLGRTKKVVVVDNSHSTNRAGEDSRCVFALHGKAIEKRGEDTPLSDTVGGAQGLKDTRCQTIQKDTWDSIKPRGIKKERFEVIFGKESVQDLGTVTSIKSIGGVG